jgi:anti-sigma factor ChrR (cupin superfamily)
MNALALRGLLDIAAHASDYDWQPFHPGIDCVPIYDGGQGGSAAMLLRYQPGARAPAHHHIGHEHILILSGSQSDERGRHPTGSLLIHPPGTDHHVYSEDGCIVLAIWEKRVRFIENSS